MKIFEFPEETDYKIKKTDFDTDIAWSLHQEYSNRIEIQFPSRITDDCYILRSKGYIGQIPLSDDSLIIIQPKVPIQNVFRMLEYAYKLKSFEFLDGLVATSTLQDLFERLASILAKRVIDRAHKGLYQDYVTNQNSLAYLRGRTIINESLKMTIRGKTKLTCRYEELTSDLDDNRILTWTLYQLPKFNIQRQDVYQQVCRAYRILVGAVETVPINAVDCIRRFYHRLNEDYEVLHSICRFFLEHCGPSLQSGQHKLMPFLVSMPNLFESFVAEWLTNNLPVNYHIESQYTVRLNESGSLSFRIDLVLYDTISGKVLAVIDTKYKKASEPEENDIQQIVAYALKMKTQNAVLVYPTELEYPSPICIGDITVRNLTFDIGNEPDIAGRTFLKELTEVVVV